VLSTATQPAYEAVPIFARVQAQEIVPDPKRFFDVLKRVRYEWRQETPLSWQEVADLLRGENQALCIVNTKQDALDLLDALGEEDALHLSTLLCGLHRRRVIEEVKRRLSAGERCLLVATQVVEAGVDLDFPMVLRAMAPLPSIVQAAGRANREGRLAYGRVVVFRPEEEKLPGKDYRRATQISDIVLNMGLTDMDDPAAMRQYFTTLYRSENTDRKDIQGFRKDLDYAATARAFRLIEDNTMTVVVPYGNAEERRVAEEAWLSVEAKAWNLRELLRRLQPYTVSLYQHQAEKYKKEGWIQASAILPDLGLWLGEYDPVRGLQAGLTVDNLVF
jgi:CRISPR-associated endonuclease/helicase Cas3